MRRTTSALLTTQGNTFVLFTPLPPYETPSAIDQICDSYNRVIDTQEIDPLILIPVFIHDFLCIHPFSDGNGRMSRLLTTLLLYRSGYYIGKYISLESKIARNKNLYYDALEASQHGWFDGTHDPTPFIKYILSVILAAYRDFDERMELVDGKQSALEIVRQAVERKLGKFTKNGSDRTMSHSWQNLCGKLHQKIGGGRCIDQTWERARHLLHTRLINTDVLIAINQSAKKSKL